MNTHVRLLSIMLQLGLHKGGKAIAFMLVGLPGIGKTYGLYAICNAIQAEINKKFPCEVWSGPQIQAEDAAGLPVPDLESGTTRLLPLRIGNEVIPAKAGAVIIDEFGSISNSQEAAFLNLLQGGTLGERTLPEEVARGACMNPEDCASNGRGLSSPASNRLVWIKWELDASTFCDYMEGGKGFAAHVDILPKDWKKKHNKRTRFLIANYIKRNPQALHQMPPAHDSTKAWPSPRSWENFSTLYAAVLSLGETLTSDLAYEACAGCLGDGGADGFFEWMRKLDLPDPEELLKFPKKAAKLLPDRSDNLTIALESLAIAACEERDKKDEMVKRWETAWEIITPIVRKRADVALSAARQLAKNIPEGDKKVAKMPEVTDDILDILRKAGLAV